VIEAPSIAFFIRLKLPDSLFAFVCLAHVGSERDD
jgi:hypothetical protein